MISCRGCAETWTANAAAHCSSCHVLFSNVANFDRHRVGDVNHRRCSDPVEVGLELRKSGLWSMPSDPDYFERFKKQ